MIVTTNVETGGLILQLRVYRDCGLAPLDEVRDGSRTHVVRYGVACED
jgi:hypothetical protein